MLIARALVSDTQLLLLDEPTAGVDPQVERSLTDLLHRLNERLPIVVVSHDVSFVSTHLKRVACLNRRMTCHAAGDISWDLISHIYHEHVRPVQHAEQCPLSDPGCKHGCAEPGEEARPADASGQRGGRMIRFFHDMAENPFLATGLAAGLLASLACGVIGPYVVTRRIVFLSGAIAHMAVGGIGTALFLAASSRRPSAGSNPSAARSSRPWRGPC